MIPIYKYFEAKCHEARDILLLEGFLAAEGVLILGPQLCQFLLLILDRLLQLLELLLRAGLQRPGGK
jgi:hypothetical protein